MHGDVTEIDVQQLRVRPVQNSAQSVDLDARNLPRPVEQLPEPKPAQEMSGRFTDQGNRLKREEFVIFPVLRYNDRPDALERGNLPVDVQHLRFEKGCAIRCDNRPRFNWSAQRLNETSNVEDQTTNFLEKEFEKFNPPPLSRFVEDHAVGARAIFRRRFRVEHLQDVA